MNTFTPPPLRKALGAALLALALLACQGPAEDITPPTPLDPEQARIAAGLPSEAEQAASQTAAAPSPTLSQTPSNTPTFTPSPGPSSTPSHTLPPSATLSAIRQTEVYVIAYLTQVVGTATGYISPTPSPTDTPSPSPSATLTATPTPLATIELPPGYQAPNRVIFSSDRAGGPDIWLMGLDGNQLTPLVLSPASRERAAACNPDGREFVFESDRGGDREIYLGTFDSSTPPRPLTDTEGENYAPAWSPTGERIAFVSTREGQASLWLMDSGGGNVARIPTGPGVHAGPQWSRDAGRLYYSLEVEGQADIYAYDFAQAGVFQITDTPDRDETAPSLAFDGQGLAFISNQIRENDSTGALWLGRGGEAAELYLTAAGRVDSPFWLDQNRLLAAADLGGITHILLLNTRDGRQSILSNLGPFNGHPQPCYVLGGGDSILPPSSLPTPTPSPFTPSPTPDLINDYTAVVNPGGEWQTREARYRLAELAALFPESGAQAAESAGILSYTWPGGHRLSLSLQSQAGALLIEPLSYTLNDSQSDIRPEWLFAISEGLLLQSIPTGLYRLVSVDWQNEALVLTFQIPPGNE